MDKINGLVLRAFVQTFCGDRKGVTAIEYGLIAGLVAVAIIGGLNAFGGKLGTFFTGLSTTIGNTAS